MRREGLWYCDATVKGGGSFIILLRYNRKGDIHLGASSPVPKSESSPALPRLPPHFTRNMDSTFPPPLENGARWSVCANHWRPERRAGTGSSSQ